MKLTGKWKCPYCGVTNSYHVEEPWNHPHLVYCGVDEGGCGSMVVLWVEEICVEFRVLRVEGEGEAESAAPVAAPPMAIVARTPVLATNGTNVVIEADLPQAMEGPLNMRHLAAPAALSSIVERLEGGASFASLQKETRLRLISIYGEHLARHVGGPPTMAQWGLYAPQWMPSASGIQQTYDIGDLGWKGMSQEWFENGEAR